MIINIDGVDITHPNRVMFECGVTKLDIVRYYQRVWGKMLPFIKNRPVTLLRSPHGLKEGAFYQRHPQENFPEYIDRVKVYTSEWYNTYIAIDELRDVLFLVNLGVIEFHTWACRQQSLDIIDYGVFDLDPGEDVSFKDIIELALRLKNLVDKDYKDNLSKVLVKTSGKKGLHLMLYFKKKLFWAEGKRIIKEIAQRVVDKYPNLYTIDVRKNKRKGKIFIDYLRNYKGSTTVAPYSLRAWDCASVSMPVKWSELPTLKSADQFNIHNVF